MDKPRRGHGPRVSVIVLNWNGLDLTKECLDSLQKVSYPNLEVILVDNGSLDGSQGYFRENYPWVRLIENSRNLGFAGGNNVGMRSALKGDVDYILLLNNDTVVDPRFIDELVEKGESRADIGVLCPKIYYYDDPDIIWYAGGSISLLRGASRHFGFREIDMGQHDTPREVNFVTGCAFFIKRAVIEKIGLLDEAFFIYSEDADWSTRAVKAGYRCWYVPASRIWHKEGMSSKCKPNGYKARIGTRNMAYLIYKHAKGPKFALCLGSFIMSWLLPGTAKGLLKGRSEEVAGMWKGLLEFRTMDKTSRGPSVLGIHTSGARYGEKAC